MHHCFNCGEELGVYVESDPMDHCGKHECQRAATDIFIERREEAHRRLDEREGW